MKLDFRSAVDDDLPAMISLLADDEIGKTREDTSSPINPAYQDAMQNILSDPNNDLIAITKDGALIGMLQLTFIPYLTHTGSWRCLVEGVRVRKDYRGLGIGTKAFQWAIDTARVRGCKLIQLTSDKRRPKAIAFYESLGFSASHEGFKLSL